jgi:signal transduction histidine kinase
MQSSTRRPAAQFSDPGGCAKTSAVRVSVRDNGIGIPPDQLPQLFEMFYQVDRSIERAHAGLGIGLTLVERLVRTARGRPPRLQRRHRPRRRVSCPAAIGG